MNTTARNAAMLMGALAPQGMPPIVAADPVLRQQWLDKAIRAKAVRERVNSGGSHPCIGNCGRLVSANKFRCLKCAAVSAVDHLASEGVTAQVEDVYRAMRKEAGVE